MVLTLFSIYKDPTIEFIPKRFDGNGNCGRLLVHGKTCSIKVLLTEVDDFVLFLEGCDGLQVVVEKGWV